jgi:hypothetical protein
VEEGVEPKVESEKMITCSCMGKTLKKVRGKTLKKKTWIQHQNSLLLWFKDFLGLFQSFPIGWFLLDGKRLTHLCMIWG